MNPTENIFLNQENRRLINVALVLTLIVGVITIVSLYFSRSVRIEKQSELVQKVNPLDGTKIIARSAIVVDLKTQKVLYERDADTVRPLASITKIMTAITALDLLPDSSVVTISNDFLSEEGDSGFFNDERWQLQELLDYSMVTSSNDGVAAIASAAGAIGTGTIDTTISRQDFIKKMNEKVTELNLVTPRFYNESGLDIDSNLSGGYASARDTARIFGYALRNKPEIFEATRYSQTKMVSLNNISHSARNTNDAVNALPGLIASKTGYTDLAGGNLGVIIDPELGRPIVIIVLGSTLEGRFADVELLAQKTMAAIAEGF